MQDQSLSARAAEAGDERALRELVEAHNARVRHSNAVVATAIALNPGVMKFIPGAPGEAQAFADAFMAALARADEAALKNAGRVALANTGRNRPARVAEVVPFPARRESRPRERRDGSGSRTSSSDPGDPDSEPPGPDWRWSHVCERGLQRDRGVAR